MNSIALDKDNGNVGSGGSGFECVYVLCGSGMRSCSVWLLRDCFCSVQHFELQFIV